MVKMPKELPVTLWRLTPSFRIEQVTLVKKSYSMSYLENDKRKSFHLDDLYYSKHEAYDGGIAKVDKIKANAKKILDSTNKKYENLNKTGF